MPLPKALALAGVPFMLSNSEPAAPVFMAHPFVRMVECDKGKGTAFRVGDGIYLSVDHVTRLTGCTIDGRAFVVIYRDPAGDFSVLLRAERPGGTIAIDCGGFRDGQWYYAVGHAGGQSPQRVVTISPSPIFRFLAGGPFDALVGAETVIPGMSGGPVLNSRGQAVGTVNAYNSLYGLSYSRALKGTPLCPSSPGA